jgi:ParB family chromosome partitioning protein
MGLSKKLITPSVVEAVVRKVAERRITNPKDLRKLRSILPDPVARTHFLSDEGDIDSALLRLAPGPKKKAGFASELEAAVESMKRVPWIVLAELRGDPEILRKIDEAEALLKSLRGTLAS